MATCKTTSAELEQARVVLNTLATLASEVDRSCYFTHGSIFDNESDITDRLSIELSRLRDAIRMMGWYADLASEKIGGGAAKGGAEAWLLPPAFDSAVVEARNG